MADLQRSLPAVKPPKGYKPPTEFPDLSRAKRVIYDLETHDPDLRSKGPGPRRDGYMVGMGVRTNDGFAQYYPTGHVVGENCNPDRVIEWMRDQAKNLKGELVGANLMYEGDYSQEMGIHFPHVKWRDVQFAEPLLDETALSYSLDTLAHKYGLEAKGTQKLKKLYGPDVMKHFREVHPYHATEYNMDDLRLPDEILNKQLPLLRKQRLTKLFDIESRLTPLLLYMRRKGVRVDLEKAEHVDKYLAKRRDESLLKMQKIAGFSVDPDSPINLVRACESLDIPFPLTEKGNPSFNKLWVDNIAAEEFEDYFDPAKAFVAALRDARKYEKARNPFITNYILGSHLNGRIHALFHPLRTDEFGTRSGRFSSSFPNLQNIPARDPELGPLLRSLFIPEPGWRWYSKDYSQIEYRLLVHFSVEMTKKKNLANLLGTNFNTNDVITSALRAQEMYRTNPDTDFHQMVAELTGLDRKPAKNLNFGLVYGMGIRKLARKLGLVNEDGSPTPKALEIMETYHGRAPFIKALYRLCDKQAQHHGSIRTLLNRYSRFNLWEQKLGTGINLEEWYKEHGRDAKPLPYEDAVEAYGESLRRSGTHKALNRLLQGSAADIAKLAMLNAWEAGLFSEGSPLTCATTVHDEIDGSVEPGARGDKALAELDEYMREAFKLNVPVLVGSGVGDNWAEAH